MTAATFTAIKNHQNTIIAIEGIFFCSGDLFRPAPGIVPLALPHRAARWKRSTGVKQREEIIWKASLV